MNQLLNFEFIFTVPFWILAARKSFRETETSPLQQSLGDRPIAALVTGVDHVRVLLLHVLPETLVAGVCPVTPLLVT